MNDLERLQILLRNMHLPTYRKSSLDKHGLLWLARNMGMQNSEHPKYPDAVELLKKLLKEKLYKS
jgi:hypothetical protein